LSTKVLPELLALRKMRLLSPLLEREEDWALSPDATLETTLDLSVCLGTSDVSPS